MWKSLKKTWLNIKDYFVRKGDKDFHIYICRQNPRSKSQDKTQSIR